MRNQELFSGGTRGRQAAHTPRAGGLLRGVLAATALTLGCIVAFALIMRALKPSDLVVSAFNQILKLASILAGVWVGVGRGNPGGAGRGALIGLLYMALGVGLYALLSGEPLALLAYAADMGMGVAAGGLSGVVVSNLPAAK
ncbi:MAG: TIGR04086 family membrane protein [Oscillospiraceae bacterium]|jgi:putative membrane protein (TIGR04086 family)|nr:TIGR04086 family membrane protein [Oscillospiraceae bacterium]